MSDHGEHVSALAGTLSRLPLIGLIFNLNPIMRRNGRSETEGGEADTFPSSVPQSLMPMKKS